MMFIIYFAIIMFIVYFEYYLLMGGGFTDFSEVFSRSMENLRTLRVSQMCLKRNL